MQGARVVRGTSNRPASYYADVSAWSTLLKLEASGRNEWRYQADVFAFLIAVIEWGAGGGDEGYVAASTARDIVEAHRLGFELNHLILPESEGAVGTRYLKVFGDIVFHVQEWLKFNL